MYCADGMTSPLDFAFVTEEVEYSSEHRGQLHYFRLISRDVWPYLSEAEAEYDYTVHAAWTEVKNATRTRRSSVSERSTSTHITLASPP